MGKKFTYSLFTKRWKTPLSELGKFIKSLGFDGVELPIRSGYQVEPESVEHQLEPAVKTLADLGLNVYSVAGPANEATIAACAKAGIAMLRICVAVESTAYLEEELRLRKDFEALVPVLSQYNVTLGVQNHGGRCVASAMQLRNLLHEFHPRHISIVWDVAHNALYGEELEHALDIVWPHLCMVNLKNAFWKRVNGPEAPYAQWEPYWTTGRHGLASWPRLATELKRRDWAGVISLRAEYSDIDSSNRLIAEDIAFAKSLFE